MRDRSILESKIGETEAHCYSFTCYGTARTSAGKIKNVAAKTIFCPDCNNVLVWKSKSRKMNRNTKIKRFSGEDAEYGNKKIKHDMFNY